MSKSKSLSEIQIILQKAVRSNSTGPELLDIVKEKPPISISERVKIYQNAYRIRMTESLREDFSEVEKVVGENQFDQLIHQFVGETPSYFSNLAEYSETFPDFVKIKHPEAYVDAVKCWMKILSYAAGRPDKPMKLDEIQSGRPFLLQTSPTTYARSINGIFYTSFRKNDGEVSFAELNEKLFNLLDFLKNGQSFENISVYCVESKISDEELSKAISEWIANQVIYCKDVENYQEKTC